MSMVEKLLLIPKNACSLVSVSWISILIVSRIYDFHFARVWIDSIQRGPYLAVLDDLSAHVGVVLEVVGKIVILAVLQQPHFQLDLLEKLCGLYDCRALCSIIYDGGIPVMICIFFLYIVTPSFILPLLQRTYYAYCEQNFFPGAPMCTGRRTRTPCSLSYHQPIDTYTDYHTNTSTGARSKPKVKNV